MAYTQAQLFALESAIALGVLEVDYPNGEGRKIYRSLDEMLRIRDLMRAELGVAKTNGRRRFAEFNRGLN